MEFYSNDISLKLISTYIVFGAIIYFILGIIGKYIIPLIRNWQYTRNVNSIWQKLEIVIGAVYLFLFYYMLLSSNLLITSIFSIIIFGLGWNYWKNIFSGILMKYTRLIKKGEMIDTNDVIGEVKSINFSQTEIINPDGELVIIPNYLLRSSIIKHVNEGNNVKTYSFKMSTKKVVSTEEVYMYAIKCPYISGNQKINIKRLGDLNYMITAIMIDPSFVEDAERYFKNM